MWRSQRVQWDKFWKNLYIYKNGFQELNFKLYNRAQCFEFEAVKKLLELGANNDIHFENDGDSSTLSRILGETSFLATYEVISEFEKFEKFGYNQNFEIQRMFSSLLGLAAHQEMSDLIDI